MAQVKKNQKRGSLEVVFIKSLVTVKTASGLKVALSGKSGSIFHSTWLADKELRKGRVVLKDGWSVKLTNGFVDGRRLNVIFLENKALFGDGFLMINTAVIKKVSNFQTGKVLFSSEEQY